MLILSKFDLFEKKVEEVPSTEYDWFSDFHPTISHLRLLSYRAKAIRVPGERV
ncbi:hypothetical protein TanjilG_25074 [Lupinus angustifolius]|uniref:Uncharacterized protein n=1 Tax=Lupinus angustifolius TaxID=3871 RepID=A0A394DC42_LUPAN|nr:hypothetical protein TanjilG_25074 [Lupinus angustifolius]